MEIMHSLRFLIADPCSAPYGFPEWWSDLSGEFAPQAWLLLP